MQHSFQRVNSLCIFCYKVCLECLDPDDRSWFMKGSNGRVGPGNARQGVANGKISIDLSRVEL